MKQRLFENVGGNKFILTESISNKTELIRGGIKKVFSAGHKTITYAMLENVGLGYINDVNEARKVAIQEAKAVAEHCGYCDDDKNAKFVKEEDFYDETNAAPSNSETNVGNPEEKREVQIGREILALSDRKLTHPVSLDLQKISELARELIKMHGQE
jgi:hypothetical protein